ncbi:hypothetical protein EW145_g3314 [Phellinidium pouzarii]|uniref:Uncharacterized protein n=1 Tax=Phellinidium pouzarii TaxID=167371 RepID=A0A4S4L7J1_9AGAM|nr:hypothetical protein EW145_g3314 [Phellinidium pouzarii]
MIIVDEDGPDTKSPTATQGPLGLSPVTASDHSAPPPAYTPSSYGATGSSGGGLVAPVYATPLQYPYDVPVASRERLPRGENARRRFCSALAVALGVWVLLGILLADVKLGLYVGFPDPRYPSPLKERVKSPSCVSGQFDESSDSGSTTHTRINGNRGESQNRMDNSLPRTISKSDPLRQATLGFSLPASADLIYLFTNASQAYGSVTIDVDRERSYRHERHSESDEDDYVKVDVTVSSFTERGVQHARLCLFEESGEWGLGIVTPPQTGIDSLDYDFHIIHPAPVPSLSSISGSTPPLNISRFHSNLPLFEHYIDAPSNRVHFGEFELQSENMAIKVPSLSAGSVRLKTENGPIEGNFSVITTLELLTQNAAITVDVHLDTDSSSTENGGKAADVILHTQNAPINARMHHSPSGRDITVNATTSNALLSLLLSSLPPSPPLPSSPVSINFPAIQLTARSSNAPIIVSPGPAFTGALQVATRGPHGIGATYR